ncbi:MAG: hypothetical protein AB7K52_02525 [Phycisphaerales bacterium]
MNSPHAGRAVRTMLALSVACLACQGLRADPPATPADDPLAGPSIQPAAAERKSLVERDFDGKVKRLEVLPIVAAIELIKLEPGVRAQIDEIIARRNAALDALVRDNLRLIVELAGANQAGKKDEAGKLLRELYAAAAPLRELGPLQVEIQRALPAGAKSEAIRLTQEYWSAIVAEATAERSPRSDEPGASAGDPEEDRGNMADRPARQARRDRAEGGGRRLIELRRAEVLAAAGGEIRRAYERVVGQQAADFEALIGELNLNQEQESKVRQVVGDLFQKTYGKPTPAQRAGMIAEVWRVLDADQRATLLKRLRG